MSRTVSLVWKSRRGASAGNRNKTTQTPGGAEGEAIRPGTREQDPASSSYLCNWKTLNCLCLCCGSTPSTNKQISFPDREPGPALALPRNAPGTDDSGCLLLPFCFYPVSACSGLILPEKSYIFRSRFVGGCTAGISFPHLTRSLSGSISIYIDRVTLTALFVDKNSPNSRQSRFTTPKRLRCSGNPFLLTPCPQFGIEILCLL